MICSVVWFDLTARCQNSLLRYENLVQIRCLLEGMPPEEMLSNWGQILPKYMEQWGLERGKVGGELF